MGVIAWLAIAIGLLTVVVGVLAVWMLKQKKTGTLGEPNYRIFWIMGAVMTPVGSVFMLLALMRDYSFFTMMPLFAIGVLYLAIGWRNRNKQFEINEKG